MKTEIELMLENEVEYTIYLYEKYNSKYASRTRNMIENKGIIKALDELMISAEYQQGFKVLHEHKQLDKTFEALVVKYNNLFTNDAVQCAKFRLNNPDALKNL